jgi:hypothetical protein
MNDQPWADRAALRIRACGIPPRGEIELCLERSGAT